MTIILSTTSCFQPEIEEATDINASFLSIPTEAEIRRWLIREAFRYKRVRCLIDIAALSRHYNHLENLVKEGKPEKAFRELQNMIPNEFVKKNKICSFFKVSKSKEIFG